MKEAFFLKANGKQHCVQWLGGRGTSGWPQRLSEWCKPMRITGTWRRKGRGRTAPTIQKTVRMYHPYSGSDNTVFSKVKSFQDSLAPYWVTELWGGLAILIYIIVIWKQYVKQKRPSSLSYVLKTAISIHILEKMACNSSVLLFFSTLPKMEQL